MASQFERGTVKRPSELNSLPEKPLTFGLYGESLGFIRPAERHTKGAKEAWKAQKM